MSPAPQRRPSARPASGRGPRRSGGSQKSAAQGRYDAAEELHPIDTPPDIENFDHWPLDPLVARAIRNMEIAVPTPIQRLAIGPVLEGRDVIAKAETGTGKTLAFGAPMVSKLDAGRASVLGLVLCPTRELAQQVANVLRALGHEKGLKVALVVGGDPMQPQIKELQAGAQLVVGTPGRVLDLMKQRFLSFPWTEFAVLDEADEMLEIGFLDDVEAILNATPEERQTLLFSATFPPPLLALARKHTKTPVELATARGVATVDRIAQSVCFTSEEDRPHELRRLLLASSPSDLFLIFCDRRMEVDRLMRRLERLPVAVKALHGGYDQEARFRVMSAFRGGEVRALVATDVASRGLDVTGVTHVINYSPPRDISDYTHRIGRTGRAGRHGKALTFVAGGDQRRWGELTARMTWPVEELEPRQMVRQLLAPPRALEAQATEAEPAESAGPRAAQLRDEPRRDEPVQGQAQRGEFVGGRGRQRPVATDAGAPHENGGEPRFEAPAEKRGRRAASPAERGPRGRWNPEQAELPTEPFEEPQEQGRAERPAERSAGARRAEGPRPGPQRSAGSRDASSGDSPRAERADSPRRHGAPEPAAPRARPERGPLRSPSAPLASAPPPAQRPATGQGAVGPRELFEARRRERAERIRRDREQRRLALGLSSEGLADGYGEPAARAHAGRSAEPQPSPRPARQPHLGLAPRDRIEPGPDFPETEAARPDPARPARRIAPARSDVGGADGAPREQRQRGADRSARRAAPNASERAPWAPRPPDDGRDQPEGQSAGERAPARGASSERRGAGGAEPRRERREHPRRPMAGDDLAGETRPASGAAAPPSESPWSAQSAEPLEAPQQGRGAQRSRGAREDKARATLTSADRGAPPTSDASVDEPAAGARRRARRPAEPSAGRAAVSAAGRPAPEAAPELAPESPADGEPGPRRRRSRRGPPPEIEAPPIHGSSTPADQSPGWGGFGEGL
jgi:ATP-dependent RNA helicase DeaD